VKKSFSRRDTYKVHVRSHTGEKPYACTICCKAFSSVGVKRVHMKSHESDKEPVAVADKFSLSKRKLKEHLEQHSKNDVNSTPKEFKCKQCSDMFSSADQLNVHYKQLHEVKKHKGKKSLMWQYCGKAVECPTQLVMHDRSHTNEKPFTCIHCKKSYSTAYSLKNHMDSHTHGNPYICEVCERGFLARSTLARHAKIHKGGMISRFLCEFCGLELVSVMHLKLHMLSHSCLKSYQCKACSDTFHTTEELSSHMKFHYKHGACQPKRTCKRNKTCRMQKRDECIQATVDVGLNGRISDNFSRNCYKCNLCEKKVYTLFKLRFHMLTHNSGKRYKCKYCLARFSSRYHAKLHVIRWHMKQTYNNCAISRKGITHPAVVKSHLKSPIIADGCGSPSDVRGSARNRLHDETQTFKPYICPRCFRGCVSKHNLISHLAWHERRHECIICEKQMSSFTSLKNHVNRHTGEMPHACKCCGRRFRSGQALAYHRQDSYV